MKSKSKSTISETLQNNGAYAVAVAVCIIGIYLIATFPSETATGHVVNDVNELIEKVEVFKDSGKNKLRVTIKDPLLVTESLKVSINAAGYALPEQEITPSDVKKELVFDFGTYDTLEFPAGEQPITFEVSASDAATGSSKAIGTYKTTFTTSQPTAVTIAAIADKDVITYDLTQFLYQDNNRHISKEEVKAGMPFSTRFFIKNTDPVNYNLIEAKAYIDDRPLSNPTFTTAGKVKPGESAAVWFEFQGLQAGKHVIKIQHKDWAVDVPITVIPVPATGVIDAAVQIEPENLIFITGNDYKYVRLTSLPEAASFFVMFYVRNVGSEDIQPSYIIQIGENKIEKNIGRLIGKDGRFKIEQPFSGLSAGTYPFSIKVTAGSKADNNENNNEWKGTLIVVPTKQQSQPSQPPSQPQIPTPVVSQQLPTTATLQPAAPLTPQVAPPSPTPTPLPQPAVQVQPQVYNGNIGGVGSSTVEFKQSGKITKIEGSTCYKHKKTGDYYRFKFSGFAKGANGETLQFSQEYPQAPGWFGGKGGRCQPIVIDMPSTNAIVDKVIIQGINVKGRPSFSGDFVFTVTPEQASLPPTPQMPSAPAPITPSAPTQPQSTTPTPIVQEIVDGGLEIITENFFYQEDRGYVAAQSLDADKITKANLIIVNKGTTDIKPVVKLGIDNANPSTAFGPLIRPNEKSSLNMNLDVLSSGQHKLIATLEVEGDVNQGNNQLIIPFTVIAPPPVQQKADFTTKYIDFIQLDSTGTKQYYQLFGNKIIAPNKETTLRIETVPDPYLDTPRTTVAVYIDGQLREKYALETYLRAGLFQGNVKYHEIGIGTFTSGKHMIKLVFDPDNSYVERDETNNIFEKEFSVEVQKGAVDVSVADISQNNFYQTDMNKAVPGNQLIAYKPITAMIGVENLGDEPSYPLLYAALNNVRKTGSGSVVYKRSKSLQGMTFDGLAPGNYEILIEVDPLVGETNLVNNNARMPITVVAEKPHIRLVEDSSAIFEDSKAKNTRKNTIALKVHAYTKEIPTINEVPLIIKYGTTEKTVMMNTLSVHSWFTTDIEVSRTAFPKEILVILNVDDQVKEDNVLKIPVVIQKDGKLFKLE